MPPTLKFDSGLEKSFRGMFLSDRKLLSNIHTYHFTGDKDALDQSESGSDAGAEKPLEAPSAQATTGDNENPSKVHDHPPPSTHDKESPSAGLGEKTRFVFRSWPRDPNGPPMAQPSTSFTGGKVAGEDAPLLWGATLYDFYHVCRIPTCQNYVSITTGSRMLAWVKDLGEMDHAKDEIEWAEQEQEPRKRVPYDVLELGKDLETRVRLGVYKGASMARDAEGDGDCSDAATSSQPSRADDPFHSSQYPKPWPLAPFAYSAPLLQERLPYYLLPEKLIVHDPCNILAAEKGRPLSKPWSKNTKYTPRTYSLSLSRKTKTLVETQRKKARDDWEKSHKSTGLFFACDDPLSIDKTGPVDSPIFVPTPPPPPPPFSTPVAHLYLSASELKGRGNHSLVYSAEWELPKSILQGSSQGICKACVMEAANEVITQQYEAAMAENPDEEPSHPTMSKEKGTMKIEEHVIPGIAFDIISRDEFESKGEEASATHDPRRRYTITEPHVERHIRYDGPVRRIELPESRWATILDPSRTCSHRRVEDAPATIKVQVTAKLSLQHDDHLALEADNYQKFTDTLFEHWTGFNVLPPLHDPTPVGAVVPQFYGYYEAVKEKGEKTDGDTLEDGYLSPILLLEDCGKPIVVEKLSIDDRQECAALLYRFHHAGWIHGSFYPRNILMQIGDIADFPLARMTKGERRFRLIDFGRALHIEDMAERHQFPLDRSMEESKAKNQLNLGL